MDGPVVIIAAGVVLAAISFLVFGLFDSRRGAKATKRVAGTQPSWTAQATLAEMRKEGAGLPADAGQQAARSDRPDGPNAAGS